MRIVIAGCGKVGKTMVGNLVSEGHDILIIDNDPEVIEEITNIYDVMGICGNCADSDIVREADAAAADMYIAVTTSDEVNMLSCFIAKRMGAKNTIARIRAPEYNDNSLAFMKENLELAMPLNPERLAAHEIFNILKFPSALKVERFSHSNMEIVEARITEDSTLNGVKLLDIRTKFKAQVLICCVQRGEEVFIPGGNFVLRGGDKIGLTAPHAELQKFFKSTGLLQRPVRNVMILGGSRVAYYLAQMLLDIGTAVKIIDSDEKICESLGDDLPRAVVICGDGSEQELLLEEGILAADAFVALTGSDETNILVSMFATMNGVKKVIAKVNRDEITPMAEKLGLDSIFSPRKIVSDVVLSYASALQNSKGSNIETLYKIMDDKVEALEFNVRADAKCIGIPLKDLCIRKNTLIIGIIRGREAITPSGSTKILSGDRVMVISANKGLRDLSDILER
ncbi:MAG: Trk system potassium transporter TrkA [Clostridia bacterium]|nr:Trk system potassium transporter TrkA [Clostridia bacterium]